MAKGKGQRPLPSTPGSGTSPAVQPPSGRTPEPTAPASPAAIPAPAPREATPASGRARVDEPYVLAGTGCLAGHERGHELEAGPIGTLPTRRTGWIGFGLVLWCSIGLALILDPQWVGIGVLVLLAWLAFSGLVQRRLGHRGKCWRTRTWRQAWGGLVPGSS